MALTPGKIAVGLMARELHHGGTERQLAETAFGLDPERFEVSVITFIEGGFRWDQLRERGVRTTSLGIRSFYSRQCAAAAIAFRRYIRENRLDIVHAFDMPAVMWGIPVARVMSSAVALASQRGHRSLSSARERHLVRIADRFAHATVVNCEYMRLHLEQDFGADPARVHVAHNGIDTAQFYPAPDAARPAPLTQAKGVIGTLAVLRPEKGIETLIEAFSRVAPNHPGWKLAIVGSGSELGRLKAAAVEFGLADNCWFEPGTRDVTGWLRAMDVFVLPTFNEALSNALMEAMACGCAPLATRVGGNTELITAGENGLLFEVRDAAGLAAALDTLITNRELAKRYGSRSAEIIRERFSREVAAARMGQIYERLVATVGARRRS